MPVLGELTVEAAYRSSSGPRLTKVELSSQPVAPVVEEGGDPAAHVAAVERRGRTLVQPSMLGPPMASLTRQASADSTRSRRTLRDGSPSQQQLPLEAVALLRDSLYTAHTVASQLSLLYPRGLSTVSAELGEVAERGDDNSMLHMINHRLATIAQKQDRMERELLARSSPHVPRFSRRPFPSMSGMEFSRGISGQSVASARRQNRRLGSPGFRSLGGRLSAAAQTYSSQSRAPSEQTLAADATAEPPPSAGGSHLSPCPSAGGSPHRKKADVTIWLPETEKSDDTLAPLPAACAGGGFEEAGDTLSGADIRPKFSREPMNRRCSGQFRVESRILQSRSPKAQNHRKSEFSEAIQGLWQGGARWDRLAEIPGLFVRSSKFEVLASTIIIANIICLGIETHYIASTGDKPAAFAGVNMAFDLYFFLEVFLRMLAYGKDYYSEAAFRWNAVDILTVILCLIPDIIGLVCRDNRQLVYDVSIIRVLLVLRIARVTRTVRMFKGLTSTSEFQKMAVALFSSARTLLWSMTILFFVMYFFSLIFCHAVGQAKVANSYTEEELAQLEKNFGTLPTSLLTVFMSITSGISWHIAFDSLRVLHWKYSLCFVIYIAIVLFGVMNVVTSVFVESAIMSAQHYKDLIIQAKERERQIAIRHISQVFKHIDVDDSGAITSDEMESFWDDPNLRQYISALDINVEDARTLFRLLDRDGTQLVDIGDFCEGCLRLKGEAKALDMHLMMLEMQTFLERWSDFTVYVEEGFMRLSSAIGRDAMSEISVAH